jgi:hypothetical protein
VQQSRKARVAAAPWQGTGSDENVPQVRILADEYLKTGQGVIRWGWEVHPTFLSQPLCGRNSGPGVHVLTYAVRTDRLRNSKL